jgi:hypothetical protein
MIGLKPDGHIRRRAHLVTAYDQDAAHAFAHVVLGYRWTPHATGED